MSELEKIKEIVTKWRDNKCVRCNTRMTYNQEDGTFKCPNCVMIDVQNNMYHALMDIGMLTGVLFFITGSQVDSLPIPH